MEQQQLYHRLLHNEQQLRLLWRCDSLEQFVALMAEFLIWPRLDFEQLLQFLRQQNQQVLKPELELFSRCWLPYAYKKAGQQLLWLPAFLKPEQPFLEDDFVCWRQNILAQLIRPLTALQPLLAQLSELPEVRPDLLIFHWSRCGSTLVSGCLMLEPQFKVLSESMLISDVLMDPQFASQQELYLDLLVRLQGRFRHQEQKLVIKCNAWDLQHWRLWTKVFPQSRLLGLIRQPDAILASHQRLSGRHMVRQQAELWPDIPAGLSLLAYRIEVIKQMAVLMTALRQQTELQVLDYQDLVKTTVDELAALLGVQLDNQQRRSWQQRRSVDAKARQTVFVAPQQDFLLQFTQEEQQFICSQLGPYYQLLLAKGLA